MLRAPGSNACGVFSPPRLAPAQVLGEMWVPNAQGTCGALREGGVAAAGPSLPDNGIYGLLSGRCGVSSPAPGSLCIPGGAELGSWGGVYQGWV